MDFSNIFSKKTLFIIAANLIITIGLLFYTIYDKAKEDNNIVYINNSKVFESFRMTTEMKAFGDKELKSRVRVVDSLYLLLNDSTQIQSKESTMKIFIKEKEELEDFENRFSTNESSKIWLRITGYAEEFSKERGYEIVLGMQPSVNILYGEARKDVSQEFIDYINNRYEGNK